MRAWGLRPSDLGGHRDNQPEGTVGAPASSKRKIRPLVVPTNSHPIQANTFASSDAGSAGTVAAGGA